jgi:hypothetical protein
MSDDKTTADKPVATDVETGKKAQNFDILTPQKDPLYVPFGHFEDVMSIIRSGMFFTPFITGLSGNGKTMMVQQACARAKRELVRLNVTQETDEDDLLGGFRLVSEKGASKTEFQFGPVPIAMNHGAILLLDEVDLGSAKLMALQPVLEGNPVYLKKINQIIYPKPGFNIVACANTKGRGDLDGKFAGTNIMNEAFLERFAVTFEQMYPDMDTERKILTALLDSLIASPDSQDKKFIECLLMWAEHVRKAFYDGSCTDILTTRRLCMTLKSYHVFGRQRDKCIRLAVNRFDEDTKKVFLDTYTMIDDKVTREELEALKKASGATTPTPSAATPKGRKSSGVPF